MGWNWKIVNSNCCSGLALMGRGIWFGNGVFKKSKHKISEIEREGVFLLGTGSLQAVLAFVNFFFKKFYLCKEKVLKKFQEYKKRRKKKKKTFLCNLLLIQIMLSLFVVSYIIILISCL